MKFKVQKVSDYELIVNNIEIPVTYNPDWLPDAADNQVRRGRFTLNGTEFSLKVSELSSLSPKDIGMRGERLYEARVSWQSGNGDTFIVEEYFAPRNEYGDVLEHPAVKRTVRKALALAADRNLI